MVVVTSNTPSSILRRCVAVAISVSSLSPAAAVFAADSVTPQLGVVVVSATRTEEPLEQVGSAITVITRADLEARQTRFVADALRAVPGLAVNRTGAAGQFTQVRIRGAEGNDTLVIIDGIEVNDPSGGSEFNFGDLLAADIERIEILRGPQSALYGSDAIGGVINIITRKGKGPAHLAASVEGGSFGTGHGNASISGGGERFHYLLSGTHFGSDGISVASRQRGNRETDAYENDTLFGKIGGSPLDILDLDFVGRYTRFDTDGDGFQGGLGAVDDPSKTLGRQRFARGQAKLKLLGGRWEHILGLGYTEHQRGLQFDGNTTDTTFSGNKQRLDYQSNFYFGTPGVAAQTVSFVLDDEQENVTVNSPFSAIDRDIDTRGYAGEYQLDLYDKVFLTASVRHDDNNFFKDANASRITAAWLHQETGSKLKASWGTGVKNPTVFELFGFVQTFMGNPKLQPEQATGWDMGMEQSLFAERLKLDLTYFNQRVDQLIVGLAQTAVNFDGVSHSNGVELAADMRLGQGFNLRGTYTFTATEDPDNNELVRRPRHIASVNINKSFLENRASVNLDVSYNGQQNDVAFDEFFTSSIVSLDSYTLVNLAASYRFSKALQLFGRVENLTDTDYEEQFSFGTPGRAAYVGVRADLDL